MGSTNCVDNPQDYVIKEVRLTLTKKGYADYNTAPVITDKNYTGENVCFVDTPGTAKNGKLQYRLLNESSKTIVGWTDDYKKIVATAKGTYTVQYKPVATNTTYYADGPDPAGGGQYKQKTVKINAVKPDVIDDSALGIPTLTYTGNAQSLFTGKVYFKDANGNKSDGQIYYTLTYTNTKPTDPNGGLQEVKDLTAVNAGKSSTDLDLEDYYLWARITAGTNHSAVGWTCINPDKPQHIQKEKPEFSWYALGVYHYPGIEKNYDLVYNGSPQQLWKGGAYYNSGSKGGVSPIYGFTSTTDFNDSGSAEDVIESPTGKLADIKLTDSVDIDGNKLTYYLWYRTEERQNYSAIDWEQCTYFAYNQTIYINNGIAQATLTIDSYKKASDIDYRGFPYRLMSDMQISSNSTVMGDYVIKYTKTSTYDDGNLEVKESKEFSLSNKENIQDSCNFSVTRAGTYSIKAEWYPKEEGLSDFQKKQYVSGELELGETKIRKITVNESNIKFTGITDHYNSDMTITPEAKCYPFTVSIVNLQALGVDTDNGITNNNVLDKNNQEINRLSFCLTQGEQPAVDSELFITTTSAADFNTKLQNAFADKKGLWFLYIRIDNHINLVSNQVFKVAEFDVKAFTFGNEWFKGVTMSETVVYDGMPHKVAEGGLESNNDVKLGQVFYAVSDTPTSPAFGPAWRYSIDELDPVTEAGTYRLFVAWYETDQSNANTIGIKYDEFTIEKYDALDGRLGFQGADFSSWSKVYKNDTYTIGNIGTPVAKVAGNDSIASSEFGDFYFAVTAENKQPGEYDYVTTANFGDLKIKDVGKYWLWVKWEGGNNIKPEGFCRYKITGNDEATVFEITKKTQADGVALVDENFVIANDSEYQYRWKYLEKTIEGRPQALFGASGVAPEININDKIYAEKGITYKYLMALDVEEVTVETPGWAETIDECTATDVGNYNLWVLVTIVNDNVDLTVAIKLATGASIKKTESFVRVQPTAKNNLKQNGEELVLINASEQTNPPVEYAIFRENEKVPENYDGWITDAEQVKATDAGTYWVYYRGSANKYFYAQGVPTAGYPYITVYVDQANSYYDPRPSSTPMQYTGRGLKPFEEGWATILNEKVPLLYSWTDPATWGGQDNWRSFAELPAQVDVGDYSLFYRISSDGYTNVSVMLVKIIKADIEIKSTVETKQLVYQGANYQLLDDEINYALVDQSGNTLTHHTNDVELTYDNCKSNDTLYGTMGAISYGVSTSSSVAPTQWQSTHSSLTARTIGDYYIWVKVDNTGTNHNGIEPTCCNIDKPIRILPVTYEVDGTYNFNASQSTYGAFDGLKYNGINQVLISDLNLILQVAKRDNAGNVINDEYNDVVSLTEIGTVQYALSSNNDVNDDNENWVTSYAILGRADAGTYYLKIKIVGDANFKGPVIFCLTGDEIKISPAQKNDILVEGFAPLSFMYSGEGQSLAYGALSVKFASSRFSLASQVSAQYCYAKKTDAVPTVDADWTDFDSAKVTDVGEYILYVYLTANNSNIDTQTPLIYPLFADSNPASITRVLSEYIKIVTPIFAEGLAYEGSAQQLIVLGAGLIMTNGSEIKGRLGTATYYISSNQDVNDGAPCSTYFDVKGTNAGDYYIWVEFGAGDGHEAIPAQYIGMVTIYKASERNVVLSGLNFGTGEYNGEFKKIISTADLKQKLGSGGYSLQEDIDYTNIEYAYSSHPTIMPDNDFVWVTDVTTLKVRDAGTYYIWVKVTGTGNIADYIKCYEEDHYEIFKATLSETEIGGITYHDGLVYIAESQTLASIKNKLVIKIEDSSIEDLNIDEYNADLNIYWGLGADAMTEPESWATNIAELQGIDSGDYYIWAWVQESKNFNDTTFNCAQVKIAKATIHIDAPLIHEGLVYNGIEQELLTKEAVAKFYAVGTYYDPEKTYYDAHEVTIDYTLDTNAVVWSQDYHTIKGLNATLYKVTYRVQAKANDNWNYQEGQVEITIASVDASTEGAGLVEAPNALENVYYNEQAQRIISYGVLSEAAAEQGCKIVFYYDEDPSKKYTYSYDKILGKYVWDEEIPGRTNAGTYKIKYYITGSTEFGNFTQSAIKEFDATVNQRSVFWLIKPEPVYDFEYVTDADYPLLVPGELNVRNSEFIKVMYSLEAPGTPNRMWQDDIPKAGNPNLRYVWYYVEITDGNSRFTGDENNDPAMGTRIAVLFEHTVLTIQQLPVANVLQYTAEEQSLIDYYVLSTDSSDNFGEEAPFIEYSFDKDAIDKDWTRDIKAKDVGEHIVYYRLNYDDTIFKFNGENDGREEPMQLTVNISAIELNSDSIRAVFDSENKKVSYEVADKQVFNEEEKKWELVPMYSDTLLSELEQHMVYYYRKNDNYAQEVWKEWNAETSANTLTLGTYEFRLNITAPAGQQLNFLNYAQTELTLETYTNTGDRVIEVVVKDFGTAPYVRAWIDFTGSMKHEESSFVFESFVSDSGRLEIPFMEIDAAGNNSVIRIEAVNDNFYYISDSTISDENKKQIELKSEDIRTAKAVNQGLNKVYTTVYMYEIYNIKYDANGGKGQIAEGWKWHDIDYLIAENNFTKDGLSANGWNTSKTGSGTNYSNLMYFTANQSQTFYAKYFKKGENSFVVQWVITDGDKIYKLARDNQKWFNAKDYPTRTTGVLIDEGSLITLPQVQDTESGESLSKLFGSYILGWETDDKETQYEIGMTATENITFVAKLNSNLSEFVQCKFLSAENEELFDSGLVANGASAYMALSGMKEDLMNAYREGFTKWVEDYGTKTLDGSQSDNVLTYRLGTKSVVEETQPDETEKGNAVTWADYTLMFVIVGVGIAVVVITLFGYIFYKRSKKVKELKQ